MYDDVSLGKPPTIDDVRVALLIKTKLNHPEAVHMTFHNLMVMHLSCV